MTTIKVSKGLHQSYKNAVILTIQEVLDNLKKRTDCYEVLNDTSNRIYGDVDGKVLESCSEEEFNKIDKETQHKLEYFLTGDYALMTSSSFIHKKISWRFILTDTKTTKDKNKQFIKNIIDSKELNLPEGVKLDVGVYGKNQKMRMLGSNKDGENRPLVLVRGNPIDTLISYIPDDCKEAEILIPEKEKKKTKSKKETLTNTIIVEILNGLNDKRFDEYEDWLKIGMICFNEDMDVSIWDTASQRSLKYKSGDCETKYKSFVKSNLTIATLWEWLKQDNPTVWNGLKQNDYSYQKEIFEETHFLMKNPPRYVRQVGTEFQFYSEHEMRMLYRGMKCGEDSFIEMWLKDTEHIRTFEAFEFKPNLPTTTGYFNLFRGFPLLPQEGDWSIIHELIWDLSGRNQDVYDYILKWTAHLFQKPYEKHGNMLIFSSEKEGVGKDTFCDYVLQPLLGDEYYYSTGDMEKDIFGRFNRYLSNKLLIKLEEMEYEVTNKYDSKFKTWMTCPKIQYEEKGINKTIPFDSYHRFIGTSNEACPVRLSKSFRRFFLINPYQGNSGNTQHWNRIYKGLENKQVLQAFLFHLLSMDISDWSPREKVETDALINARASQAPPHAGWFQLEIQNRDEEGNIEYYGNEIRIKVNSVSKYPYTQYKMSQELKQYPHQVQHTNRGNLYVFNCLEVKRFLQTKHWWIDL